MIYPKFCPVHDDDGMSFSPHCAPAFEWGDAWVIVRQIPTCFACLASALTGL